LFAGSGNLVLCRQFYLEPGMVVDIASSRGTGSFPNRHQLLQITSAAIAAGAASRPANSQPIPLLTAVNGKKSMRRAGQYGTG